MSWETVRVDAAWLVASVLGLVATLAIDNTVVQVAGGAVIVADVVRWVHWLVVQTETR